MKIIDAPVPKSKSAQMRDVIKQIAGKNKAALLESESDRATFCQIARKLNLKPKSKKESGKGWLVWVI